ncbi:MAG: hypothetical protein ACREFE_09440 [Limisphaerales bacterium]
MQNNAAQNSIPPESLRRRHEAREPHLRNVMIVAASVVFMLLFCLASAGILIHFFSQSRPMHNMKPLGLISAPNLKPLERFPKPNLQIDDDHAERMKLYAAQTAELNSYGWVDRSNGIVRIPITRAMDLIVQRGLPTRTNGISQTDGSALQLIQNIPDQK